MKKKKTYTPNLSEHVYYRKIKPVMTFQKRDSSLLQSCMKTHERMNGYSATATVQRGKNVVGIKLG